MAEDLLGAEALVERTFTVPYGRTAAPFMTLPLIDTILPVVSGIVDRLQQGIDVVDIGCGSGHAVNLMAETYPLAASSVWTLADIGLATGAAEAKQKGLTNVRFLNKDAATLDGSEQYDFITTFDAVHDQARPDLVLSGMANSLRPGGQYLCVDIAAWSSWCRETRSGRRTTKVSRVEADLQVRLVQSSNAESPEPKAWVTRNLVVARTSRRDAPPASRSE